MNLDIVVAAVGTVAAVAVSQWPRIAPLLRRQKPQPAAEVVVTYQESLEALAVVRARLIDAGGIDPDAQKAIETLTLSLVQGSDR